MLIRFTLSICYSRSRPMCSLGGGSSIVDLIILNIRSSPTNHGEYSLQCIVCCDNILHYYFVLTFVWFSMLLFLYIYFIPPLAPFVILSHYNYLPLLKLMVIVALYLCGRGPGVCPEGHGYCLRTRLLSEDHDYALRVVDMFSGLLVYPVGCEYLPKAVNTSRGP